MVKFQPHDYQNTGMDHMLTRTFVEGELGAGLFLDPGMGKTAMTLQVIHLLRQLGEVKRALIVAPLLVAYDVWPAEIEKWGLGMNCTIVHGPKKKRFENLRGDADVYIINREGIPWLQRETTKTFDTLVVDESNSFKNWTAKRTRAMRKMLPQFQRRFILNGTPTSNGTQDLFAQHFILDDGEKLGRTLTYFRHQYMYQEGPYRKWVMRPGMDRVVQELVKESCICMQAEDFLDMPLLLENDVWINLPQNIRRAYERLEREMFLELNDIGEEITIMSASSKYAMCRGVANGGVYQQVETGGRRALHVHDTKVEAASNLVNELAGKSVLIAYQFHHDLQRLRKAFPEAPVVCGGMDPKVTKSIFAAWNRGEIHVLLCQPQSMSHGVNLQYGGHDIIWIGLPDIPDAYTQLIRRIWRQGVREQVRVHRILARETVDEAAIDRLLSKSSSQQQFLDSLKRYKKRKTGRC